MLDILAIMMHWNSDEQVYENAFDTLMKFVQNNKLP